MDKFSKYQVICIHYNPSNFSSYNIFFQYNNLKQNKRKKILKELINFRNIINLFNTKIINN